MALTTRGTGGYVAEVVREAERFAALDAEWRTLYQSSPRATPFQSHAWLHSWWRTYGRAGRLRVLLVRDARGQLVAAAALHLRWRGAARVLTPVGGVISDYTDVLVAEGRLTPDRVSCVISALADGLQAIRGWDLVDLPEVRDGGMAEEVFARWKGRRWRLESSTCTELHASSFDELLARLSAKRASEIRRRLRRADELGFELTDVPVGEVADGVADLIRLHARQWEGRGVNPEHLRPTFASHLCGALTPMIAGGEASLTRVRLTGDVVAVTLDLFGHRMACGYLTGVAPELYQKIDVTAFILRNELSRMSRAGLSVFSMLRGRETYKNSWRPDVVANKRLLMARPGGPLSLLSAIGPVSVAHVVALARRRAPLLRELRGRAAPRP